MISRCATRAASSHTRAGRTNESMSRPVCSAPRLSSTSGSSEPLRASAFRKHCTAWNGLPRAGAQHRRMVIRGGEQQPFLSRPWPSGGDHACTRHPAPAPHGASLVTPRCTRATTPPPPRPAAAERAFAGAGVRGRVACRRARTAPCVAELRPGSPGRGVVDRAGPGQNSRGGGGGQSTGRALVSCQLSVVSWALSVERCQLSDDLVWRPCLTAP
jgi:hypothetical protein